MPSARQRWTGRGWVTTAVGAEAEEPGPQRRASGNPGKARSRQVRWLELCLRKTTRALRGSTGGSGPVGKRWTPGKLREVTGK